MSLGSSFVTVDASVLSNPKPIGNNRSSIIFEMLVGVERLSGKVDEFLVHFPKSVNKLLSIGSSIQIFGELRTVNARDGKPVKCFIFAYNINILDSKPKIFDNSISITNALVTDKYELRCSFSDENILVQNFDISLLRSHGRKSIFQCSAWYNLASLFSDKVDVGDRLNIWGRIQSSVSNSGNRYIVVMLNKFEKIII